MISTSQELLPITFSIIWNGLLSRRLKGSRRISVTVNRQESVHLVDRATFIVNATIMAHVAFLILCTAATVCSVFYYDQEVLIISLSWVLRLLYLLLFTIEGHVYLLKVKTVRDTLKEEIKCCASFCSRRQSMEYATVTYL